MMNGSEGVVNASETQLGGPWTRFMDMHSGGGQKGPAEKIIIEAPEAEARIIFYNRFGLNPDRVTCTCCGEDYSVSESPTLEDATAFDRNCQMAYFYADDDTRVPGQDSQRFGRRIGEWDPKLRTEVYQGRAVEQRYVEEGAASGYSAYKTLASYLDSDSVLVLRRSEIEDSQRVGAVPTSGYVWVE